MADDDDDDDDDKRCGRLKRECAAMVEYLKHLEREENDLLMQNEILARECLSNGWPTELQPGEDKQTTANKPGAAKKRRSTTTTTTTPGSKSAKSTTTSAAGKKAESAASKKKKEDALETA
jgi:hypothetical protein